ncbi:MULTISPECIES: hypothetical protein [unclassified Sphingomonas]|uniref:hypothetical protein n=1 Tax=unclassified Sphingomonas TaxID=196159 RepID=UPI0006FCCC16|nr:MULTISPECIES: hypothetical protein [unclassified Sphingomonas]KQX18439.1 hypothetical protein ASD17_14855 [Sphingomonas sp. Root1294]KQY72236.1 hypothetical protein ASD39_20120 [Sphingomonas sp. Root50]KRB94493.1 hypothetical protein ASE22_00630 [Sphingomonas sp. Root720]
MTARFTITASGSVVERPATPAEEREINLHCARVYLREARARRARSPAFAATLRIWAANARRRAAAIDARPVQWDMFA